MDASQCFPIAFVTPAVFFAFFSVRTMTRCAVYGCSNNNKSKKPNKSHFYRFPKTKSVLKRWIHACCRADKLNTQTARVCSRHFKATDYEADYLIKRKLLNKSPKAGRSLRADAVPSLFLPNQEEESGKQYELFLPYFGFKTNCAELKKSHLSFAISKSWQILLTG